MEGFGGLGLQCYGGWQALPAKCYGGQRYHPEKKMMIDDRLIARLGQQERVVADDPS